MTSPGGNTVVIGVRAQDLTGPAFDSATARAKKLAQSVDGTAGSAGQAFESAQRKAGGLAGTLGKIGTIAGGILVADAVQAGARRAVQLIQSTIKASSDLGEALNATSKVFDSSTEKIQRWGEQNANSFGLSQRAFLQAATPLGAMLKNTGMDIDSVADETIKLTERAADMASVFNTEVPDALFAIQAALRGETEPIRRYGVNLNEAAIQAKALADTGKETAAELTNQEKAAARLGIIFEQTNDSAGDFKDTSDGLANAQRIATATIEDAKAKIGTAYLPIMARAAQVTGELANVFAGLPPQAQLVVAVLGGLAAAAVIAAPRIIAVKVALEAMAASSSRTTRLMGGLIGVIGKIGVALTALTVAREVANSFGFLNTVLEKIPFIGESMVLAYGDTTVQLGAVNTAQAKAARSGKILQGTMEGQIEKGETLATVWEKLHGAVLTADEAMLAAKDAVTDVGEAFDEGSKSVRGNSRAALENRIALEKAARAAAEAADAYLAQGGTAAGAEKIMGDYRRAAEKATGATGKTKDEVHDLAVELFKLPPSKEIQITARIKVTGLAQLERVKRDMDRFGGAFAHGGITGAASGGNRGGRVLVGEQGPELVDLPFGSRVHPHGTSMAMMSGAGGGATSLEARLSLPPGLERGLVRMLMEALRVEIRATRGGNVQAALGS